MGGGDVLTLLGAGLLFSVAVKVLKEREAFRNPIIIRLFLIFGGAAGTFFWLFPYTIININTANLGQYCLPALGTSSPSWRGAFANAIQVPLGLEWYDITLRNVSELEPGFVWDDAGESSGTAENAAALEIHIPTSSGLFTNINIPMVPYAGLPLDATLTEPAIPIGGQASFTFLDNRPLSVDSKPLGADCFEFSASDWVTTRWVGTGPHPTLSNGFPDQGLKIELEGTAVPNPVARGAKFIIIFIFFVLFIPPFFDYVLYPLFWDLPRWVWKETRKRN